MKNNVRKFINAWDAAKGNESERRELAEDIWYDWFCSDKSLYGRTKKFIKPLKMLLIKSAKVGEMEVSGKNCCPVCHPLYDCMRIFDKDDHFVCCISFDHPHGCEKFYQVMDKDCNHFETDELEDAMNKMASLIDA